MSTTKSNEIQLFTKMDKPYGRSYGAWTVNWWQWALSISKELNPVSDQTGQHWNTAQPLSDVYFFAGNIAYIDKTYPQRDVTILYGRSILVPILNCEANSLEYPNLKTHDDLVRHVEHDVSTVIKKELFINGIGLDPVRVPSNPRIFRITISDDNAFGITNPGSTDATADGYWAFLKPLPRGNYNIHFEGSCEKGMLNSGAAYQLKII
jgi:hypothetical protein